MSLLLVFGVKGAFDFIFALTAAGALLHDSREVSPRKPITVQIVLYIFWSITVFESHTVPII